MAAGALAQTVWNDRFAFPPFYGINDIDIVYFDDSDLSAEAEAAHSRRIRKLCTELPVWIDVKNQARVYLWYTEKFGYAVRPYVSAGDAIATFPATATAVGLQPHGKQLALCAPFGLDDLLGGIVRANKARIVRQIYETKLMRWRKLWPDLTFIDWDT